MTYPLNKNELSLLLEKHFFQKKCRELEVYNNHLVNKINAAKKLANTDELTGLFNRRTFNNLISRYSGQSQRDNSPLSVIFIDIDYFKKYNDYFGHQKGDCCLIAISDALSKICQRSLDAVIRYGGEEFVILLPSTDVNGAASVAKKCMLSILSLKISHPDSPIHPHVTISVGHATAVTKNSVETKKLLINADMALYQAKSNGRNQIFPI